MESQKKKNKKIKNLSRTAIKAMVREMEDNGQQNSKHYKHLIDRLRETGSVNAR